MTSVAVTLEPIGSQVTSEDGTTIVVNTVGRGERVIVVGGALRSGHDYLPFAQALGARGFTVHVMDRRGRGGSGPLGPGYSIDKECEDLLAVQAGTGAAAVFGHSYGGFVALEAARRTTVFSRVAVYEPGVSVKGSIRVGWMPHFQERLAAGDSRGAFAYMVRGAGFAPGPIAKMPLWYVRLVLRLAIRRSDWRKMEPLLEASVAEHEQEVALDDGTVERYGSVTARVLLLGGQRSPAFITTELFAALQGVLKGAAVELLPGLDHMAPDEKAPAAVAERVARFLMRHDA